MIIDNEPYLIEYNVRMGDPECQTILPKLKTDLLEIFGSMRERLNKINIEWSDKKSLCIVVCSRGYPDNFEKNIEIANINNISLDNNNYLFHAGTVKRNNKIYAIGGRVLNFVSLSDNFSSAKNGIIKNLNLLSWSVVFLEKI